MKISNKFLEFAIEKALFECAAESKNFDGLRLVKTSDGEEYQADSIGLEHEISDFLSEILGMEASFLCTGGRCVVFLGKEQVNIVTPRWYETKLLEVSGNRVPCAKWA